MHFCAEFYKSALLLGQETHSLSTTLISDRVALDQLRSVAASDGAIKLFCKRVSVKIANSHSTHARIFIRQALNRRPHLLRRCFHGGPSACPTNVRFAPKSGHSSVQSR